LLHVFVLNELVVAFGGEVQRGGDDAEGSEDEDGPGGGHEVEACVEVPAVPEAGVVVVEVSLGMLALFVGDGERNILQ
jgi:hypothetical protein